MTSVIRGLVRSAERVGFEPNLDENSLLAQIQIDLGFEIRLVRKVIEVLPETREIVIEIEKLLPWREHGAPERISKTA